MKSHSDQAIDILEGVTVKYYANGPDSQDKEIVMPHDFGQYRSGEFDKDIEVDEPEVW